MTQGNTIGNKTSAAGARNFSATNPATGLPLEGAFTCATSAEVDAAMAAAVAAFAPYHNQAPERRAAFLEAIADEILALGDRLVARATAESGLPEGRIVGERGRTMNQLRLFAQVVREGSWVEASIDTALPDRQPVPKPDIRKMLMPTGPVVVFGASNFPLAFSTAGGDTASALAAGCPVVVKAHPSHPGTSALIADAIRTAAEKTGMPDGVFSHLFDDGYDVGQQLVQHPAATAVAFTGSLRGGLALQKLGAARPNPIPVYAEMGSVNPVVLMPDALHQRGEALATQFAGSVCLGVGQFCTNPGLLLAVDGPELDRFVDKLRTQLGAATPGAMLNAAISAAYSSGAADVGGASGVQMHVQPGTHAPNEAIPGFAEVSAADFIRQPALHSEVFGPFTLLVRCRDEAERLAAISVLSGELTGSVISDGGQPDAEMAVMQVLGARVGRLIYNGVPTGVEVCASMHHGGPFPASTDARYTSVGTAAIKRFARPLCFQDWPTDMLPTALQDSNPHGIMRQLNGEYGKA